MHALSALRFAIFAFVGVFCFTTTHAQRSIDLNFGFATSKSNLGLSYAWERSEVNVGIKGFAWASRGGFTAIQPGITYLHRLTANNVYASVGYIASYSRTQYSEWVFDSTTATWTRLGTREVRGWDPSSLSVGLGKSFQFTRWGIHLDVNAYTPFDREFGRAWGYSLGAGGSYRFRLGD